MLVGLDFDNTIVCYDRLFHRLAVEQGLIPASVPARKGDVRDYLRRVGREPDWTALQGVAYGPRIGDAEPFPGVLSFLQKCHSRGVECVIVSHKTRHPYLGPKYDLHEAATGWLRQQGFFETERTGLTPGSVYLELTKQAKLERIAQLRCDYFIDDLPEFLEEPGFPARTTKLWFAPEGGDSGSALRRVESWPAAGDAVLGGNVEARA